MNHKYYFTKISSDGYRWNMLQRIYNEIGIEPSGSGDVGNNTFLSFDRELTEEEESKISEIMIDNPTYPPVTSNTVMEISDIWNDRSLFEESVGIPVYIYYDEEIRGSGNINRIKLHFDEILSDQQIEKVKLAYSNLIK